MAVFVIIADNDPVIDPINAAIQGAFPEANLRYGTRTWFAYAKSKTAKQIAEDIGIKGEPPPFTGVVVLQLSGPYWGRANPQVWDWLKTNFEKTDG